MVHVTFYNTYSNRNVINKTLSSQLTTTAELYDNTNVLNPELKLAWDNTYVTSSNYFYIQEFNRYYFLEDIVAEPGGAARIRGSIDVLYTYRASIGQDEVTITRAYASKKVDGYATTGPTYVRDPKFPVKPQRNIEVYEFQQNIPFNLGTAGPSNWNFVLNVMGRKPTSGGGS